MASLRFVLISANLFTYFSATAAATATAAVVAWPPVLPNDTLILGKNGHQEQFICQFICSWYRRITMLHKNYYSIYKFELSRHSSGFLANGSALLFICMVYGHRPGCHKMLHIII